MKQEVFEKIRNRKVVAICRGIDVRHILPAVESVYSGGISAFEITFDQHDKSKWKETYDSIKLLKEYGPSDITVGAGTVMTTEQLELAVKGGAEFILSPNVNVEIIKEAKRNGVLMIPGAYTPTEVANAYDSGADIIKVFPVGLLGSKYIKAIRGPMNHIPLMAVGNIDHNNFKEFLEAGCMSVGVGTNIMNPDLIHNQRYEKLTELAEKYKC